MNSIIKKIVISGFRSIENENFKCGAVNLFCGANDSGKSNVLRALNLFFNNQTDFVTSLKFSDDYNKVALTKAVRATKMKQQIKIRIYLTPPTSYGSLSNEKEVWMERTYDRNGVLTEKFSHDKKKGIIKKLFNKIKYIYIPALKGKDVLQYILGLIGEYELIDQNNIDDLNEKISKKTGDLTAILKSSNIPINTTFGLPTLLSDFWEKLSVNTSFDQTEYINNNIKGTGENKSLNLNSLTIPLTYRGEGIKSKYVPPLLEWLNKNNPDQFYIWGIDEPENSLEFGLCEELSLLYFNEYAKNTQCFLTTHSLAFINPPENVSYPPLVFRCRKNISGSTKIELLENLFKEHDKLELFEELGILLAEKNLMKEFRNAIESTKALKKKFIVVKNHLEKIQGKNKCIVLTEDSHTDLLMTLLDSSGFHLDETEVRTYEGCSNIIAARLLNSYIKEKFPDKFIVIHMDRDYNTDEEIEDNIIKFQKIGVELFVTSGTDIESHFINPLHINEKHPEISIEMANTLITAACEEKYEEAVELLRTKNFGENHKKKKSHLDEALKSLPKREPLKYTKGKSVLGILKQKIKETTLKKVNSNIQEKSKHLLNEKLEKIAHKIWKK